MSLVQEFFFERERGKERIHLFEEYILRDILISNFQKETIFRINRRENETINFVNTSFVFTVFRTAGGSGGEKADLVKGTPVVPFPSSFSSSPRARNHFRRNKETIRNIFIRGFGRPVRSVFIGTHAERTGFVFDYATGEIAAIHSPCERFNR